MDDDSSEKEIKWRGALRIIRWILISLVSFGLLYHVFSMIDTNVLINTVKKSNQYYFILGSTWFLIWPILTAYRFYLICKTRVNVDFKSIFRFNMSAQFYNAIIPSKGGDLLRSVYLKKQFKLPLNQGVEIAIKDKFIDLISLLLMVIIGGVYLGTPFALLITGLCTIGIFIIWNSDRMALILTTLIPSVATFLKVYSESSNSFKQKRGLISKMLLLAIINNIGNYAQIWIFMKAVGIKISFLLSLAYLPIAVFVGMLPISIGGIGTRDATIVYLMKDLASIEQLALIGLICTFRVLIGGVLGLLYNPKSIFFETATN